VLPGTYTARFGGEDLVGETSIEVRPEPRRAISDADRLARQQAILSVSTLAKPLRAASGRADQLTRQLGDAKKLIGDQPKASEAVAALLDTLQTELGEVRRELGRRTRSLRLIDAMDGATVLPTADQRWQIDDLWRTVPDLIARLNVLIEQRIPAFNRMLDAEGVRPAPGAPIALPRKP
jgi:ABC-type transporter Mla subunit MlaD